MLISTRDSSAYRRRLMDSPALGLIAKGKLSGAALAELVGRSSRSSSRPR